MSMFGAQFRDGPPDPDPSAVQRIADLQKKKKEGTMEHEFKGNGLTIHTQISLTDAVAVGKMLAAQGFEQQLDFLYGLAHEQRNQGATIGDMLSSFRIAMSRQSDDVLEEILPLVIDASQQIERELAQRHNAGRRAMSLQEAINTIDEIGPRVGKEQHHA